MQIALMLVPILALQGGGKLQIKDTKVGKGAAAVAGDFVTVHYTGKLLSGKQFDSSRGREPFSFLLGGGQVIKGWDQGVAGMRVGGKRVLTIPASLGYGAAGAPPDIPGGATLRFDVELLKRERARVQTLKAGKGVGAKFGDMVQVHYTGKLANGTKFDSSYDRGTPLPVTVGQGVIPGFSQGLLGMKVGEKRRVTIPSQLGYGARGAGGVIPPNANLVFDLEMVRIGG